MVTKSRSRPSFIALLRFMCVPTDIHNLRNVITSKRCEGNRNGSEYTESNGSEYTESMRKVNSNVVQLLVKKGTVPSK